MITSAAAIWIEESPDLTIRRMARDDIRSVVDVIQAAHRQVDGSIPARYGRVALLNRLWESAMSSDWPMLAEQDGVIVGFGLASKAPFGSHLWTLSLGAVLPQYQGQRIGDRLIAARLDAIANCGGGLAVVSTHHPRRFSRHGFEHGAVNPVSRASLMSLEIEGR